MGGGGVCTGFGLTTSTRFELTATAATDGTAVQATATTVSTDSTDSADGRRDQEAAGPAGRGRHGECEPRVKARSGGGIA